ncbi:MAG: hypothetical protein K0S41_32 [Anaerocolumna sp.]|nr:hypothetical protein [Anaerocolumna sp.]
MKTKRVIVLPYDKRWKEEYVKIKTILEKALGSSVISIEHVGSTSVEGLAAKPIIDIDVVIESYDVFEDVKRRLEKLRYRYEGNLGIAQREAFKYENKPDLMAHHLYVCPKNSEELNRHLVFRDYLRTHKSDMKQYGNIKLEAATLYPNDIDNYILYKSQIIDEIYRKCGLLQKSS